MNNCGACNARPSPRAGQRGVALAVVVWFIAGMSLLVAGVVLSARTDVRLAQLHVGRAQASAAGDGAISLLMADVLDGQFAAEDATPPLAQNRYQFGEHRVTVLAVPVEWLVDLNVAPEPLLAETLSWNGGLAVDEAKQLAGAVVQWRSGAAGIGTGRFEAMEDLLSVEGMNRASWDSIRDFIAISQGRAALASFRASASETLGLLAALSPVARLVAGNGLVPAGTFAKSGRSGSGSYRVDALVEVGERVWLRRRWIAFAGGSGVLPWRVARTEPARIVQRGA